MIYNCAALGAAVLLYLTIATLNTQKTKYSKLVEVFPLPYNVKLLKYPDGWQVRTYSEVVGVSTSLPVDNELDLDIHSLDGTVLMRVTLGSETGRTDGSQLVYNPFTDAVERMVEFVERTDADRARSARVSMSRTINRVYSLARANTWDWFFTLTFDPEKVDSFNYDECVKKLGKWLNNLRRDCPDLRYIVVPEKHKSGRFHFHGLFAECDALDFAESGHYTKDGQPIYNIGKYRLGWSTATRVLDNGRVTKYISKYITKELCAVAFNKKRYWASRNLSEVETEEFLVDGAELSAYIEGLKARCRWFKQLESGDIVTTYFEIDKMEGL